MGWDYLKDSWNYSDPEFKDYLTKLWWEKQPQTVDLTLDGEPGDPQEFNCEKIAQAILEKSPAFYSVKYGDLIVDFNAIIDDNGKCCATAFVSQNELTNSKSEISRFITFNPVNNSAAQHLKHWAALNLWD